MDRFRGYVKAVSRCSDCGFDWQVPHDEVLAAIASQLPQYRELVFPALSTTAWSARPADGVWSPLEYLAHMRDVTEFFNERIRRVLTEDHPVLNVQTSFAEMAELGSYQTADPSTILSQFEQRAADLEILLAGLEGSQWSRAGIGSGGDERTVLMLARRFTHELHHHFLDLERQVPPAN